MRLAAPVKRTKRWCALLSTGMGMVSGCGSPTAASHPEPMATGPQACASCHASHYSDWADSMHAHAADDPMFLAMNARGQRETGGALGDFCVRCHAPLAVARGVTKDGLNLGELSPEVRGITCVVCHTASSVSGASLDLAQDGAMRGPIADPMGTAAHASTYSSLHDRQTLESASLCGACHSVTNSHGLEVERTIDEWRTTSYARPATLRTCGRCHMPETTAAAAQVSGAPMRAVHGHSMPGVDLFAGTAREAKLVQQTLDPAISSRLCVVPGQDGADVSVTVANELVGHSWPSGATHNRRAWLELIAYTGEAVTYSSGVVADDEAVSASASPPLLVLRQQLYDDRGQPALFMWDAQSSQSLLLAPATADTAHATQTVAVRVGGGVDRVTARMHVRAIDHDVADALVATGDLARAAAAALPTWTPHATVLEWTSDRGSACLP
jgi:hypothetical protein